LPEKEEQSVHLLYGFLYVADKEEGLVIVGNPDLHSKSPGVGTLLDGNPANNFLKRALAFNPGGILTGARRITIAGTFAYILTDKSLVVVDLNNPLSPRVTATIGAPVLDGPATIAIQFRYAFVVDHQGLKVLDVTDLAQPKVVANALVPLADARNIYVARTYAYISAGKEGLAIVDVEKPDAPKLDQMFTAGGQLNDVNDVKIGMWLPAHSLSWLTAKMVCGSSKLFRLGMIPRISLASAHVRYQSLSQRRVPAGLRWPYQRASIGTARWTNPATSWQYSADAVPGP
jgi:hypothetical protein